MGGIKVELLIIFGVILLIILGLVCNIKNGHKTFRKARNILVVLAASVSVIGVITPLNWIYSFLISYFLLFVVCLLHIKYKNNIWFKAEEKENIEIDRRKALPSGNAFFGGVNLWNVFGSVRGTQPNKKQLFYLVSLV